MRHFMFDWWCYKGLFKNNLGRMLEARGHLCSVLAQKEYRNVHVTWNGGKCIPTPTCRYHISKCNFKCLNRSAVPSKVFESSIFKSQTALRRKHYCYQFQIWIHESTSYVEMTKHSSWFWFLKLLNGH